MECIVGPHSQLLHFPSVIRADFGYSGPVVAEKLELTGPQAQTIAVGYASQVDHDEAHR